MSPSSSKSLTGYRELYPDCGNPISTKNLMDCFTSTSPQQRPCRILNEHSSTHSARLGYPNRAHASVTPWTTSPLVLQRFLESKHHFYSDMGSDYRPHPRCHLKHRVQVAGQPAKSLNSGGPTSPLTHVV